MKIDNDYDDANNYNNDRDTPVYRLVYMYPWLA